MKYFGITDAELLCFQKKIKQRKVFKNIKCSVCLVEMTLCGVRISKNNIIKIPLLLFVSNNLP